MANFTVKESNKINGSTKINNADELITNNMLDAQHWLNSTDGTLDGGQDWSSGGLTVNAEFIGLGNCDNTSDLDKPISTATQSALDGKEPTISKNTAFNKNFGTTSGTVCQGNDSRLSDSRTCDNTFDNTATSRTNLDVYSKAESEALVEFVNTSSGVITTTTHSSVVTFGDLIYELTRYSYYKIGNIVTIDIGLSMFSTTTGIHGFRIYPSLLSSDIINDAEEVSMQYSRQEPNLSNPINWISCNVQSNVTPSNRNIFFEVDFNTANDGDFLQIRVSYIKE